MQALLLLLASIAVLNTNPTHTLTIEITAMKEATGDMIISVYSPSSEFLGEETYKTYTVTVEAPVTSTKVGLPAGSYGIFVAHDKNSDGEVNTNFMGIPTEAVGVSQNKFGGFSKPDFEECSIYLNTDKTIKVKLVHY